MIARSLKACLVALAALAFLLAILNASMTLMLLGPLEGSVRLASDWRRIVSAHRLGQDEITVEAAFEQVYGRVLGAHPTPEDIRALIERDLEADEPAVLDYVMVRYITQRWGQIDGRTLPPGVYLAAGPIGPDAWPSPLATHYFVFPRHGYLLVVPHGEQGRWRTAFEATASLRRRFREEGDGDELYAVVQPYAAGAYDYPTPGEPVHDLFRVSADPADVEQVARRVSPLARSIDNAGLAYRLFGRNSNSALACYVAASGALPGLSDRLSRSWLTRLRLPGVRSASVAGAEDLCRAPPAGSFDEPFLAQR